MRMTDFSFVLPDEPGALARFAAQVRTSDLNLIGLWGHGGQSIANAGEARFSCVPQNTDQFRNFAESAGLEVTEGTTFFVGGHDDPGSLSRTLE